MNFRDTYRIGVYEKATPAELSWEERLLVSKEAGFDFVEMSIDETDMRRERLDWSDDQITDLLALTRKTGMPIESICFSAQRKYPLGSKKWEKEAKELLQKGVLFAKKMGIRIIQTQGYDVYYEESSSPESVERYYRNLEEGTMFAAAHGVILANETMENDFMNTIKKAMTCCERIDSPYIQVYPDLGNIHNGTKDVIADIKSGKGHIVAAHLKETVPGKFREIPYGTGQVDFPSGIAQFYRQGVRRYVAEFWYTGEKNWKEILADNRRFLDQQFDAASNLLQLN